MYKWMDSTIFATVSISLRLGENLSKLNAFYVFVASSLPTLQLV